MKHEFENDPLLKRLKDASQIKRAPKVSEEILYRVSETKSPSPIRKFQLPRMLVSLAGGAAVLAIVASFSTVTNYRMSILSPESTELSKSELSSSSIEGLISADTQVFLGEENLSTESQLSEIYTLSSSEPEAKFKAEMADYFGVTLDDVSGTNRARSDSKLLELSTKPVNSVNFSYEDFVKPALSECRPTDISIWNGCLPIGSEDSQQIKNRVKKFLKDISPTMEFSEPVIVEEFTNLDAKPEIKQFDVTAQVILNNHPTPIIWQMLWNSRGQLLDLFNAKFVWLNTLASFPGKPTLVETVSPREAFERWNRDEVDGLSRAKYSIDTGIRRPFAKFISLFSACSKQAKGCQVSVTRSESNLGLAVSGNNQLFLIPSYDFFVGDTYVGSATALKDYSDFIPLH